jgi:hypothetical protein
MTLLSQFMTDFIIPLSQFPQHIQILYNNNNMDITCIEKEFMLPNMRDSEWKDLGRKM